MNLLEDNSVQKKESNGKKLVKILLIISVVALITVIILLEFMKNNSSGSKDILYKIFVNDVDTGVTTITNSEIKYIAIEDFAEHIGYTYYNGKYNGKPTEEKDNCYLKNENKEVIELTTLENKAYKTIEDSIVQKQYYDLDNAVILYNEKLYVSFEDLAKLTNIAGKFNDKQKTLYIYTAENLVKQYQEKVDSESGFTIDSGFINSKAIINNMLVVSKNGKYGVVDTNFKTIIGNKYKSIEYDEYTTDFVVSDDNGMFGVITNKGDSKITLKYDKLFIINYSPVLYAVVKNQKYGVINENEEIIVDINYDKLACSGDSRNNINSTFILPKIDEEDNGIVVGKDNKYGIVNLTTGKFILECIVDKINSRTNLNGEEEYFVVVDGQEVKLEEYIKQANTVKIVMPNE